MSRTNESAPATTESRVHRLETPVEWPPGHAAAYLLADEDPICVDAGMIGDEAHEAFVADLHDGGYEPDDVEHLLLTHVHIDHVGGVRPLLERASPTVYAPAIARERLSRDLETVETETRERLAEAGLYGAGLERAVDGVLEIHEGIRAAVPLEAVDVWIDDDPFEIAGREFDPLYTPGHHVTHHCYGTQIEGERAVFAGDMVVEPFRAAAIHVNFTDGVREGIDAYLESLECLADRSFDRVFPGHGPVHDAYGETIESAIQDLEDRLEECYGRLAAVCDDGGEPASAFDLAVDRTDHPRQQVMELREIIAALGTLERRGQVRSWLDDGVRLYDPATSQV